MWLVFIDVNPSFFAAFKAARDFGFKIVYVSTTPRDNVESADMVISVADFNSDVLLKKLDANVGLKNISAFWTLLDKYVPVVSDLNRYLQRQYATPLNCFSEKLILIAHNKYEMRQALSHTPYNTAYQLIDATQSARPFAGQTIVIKPPYGFASIGVKKVSESDDFNEALAATVDVNRKIMAGLNEYVPAEHKNPAAILVEQYIEGDEYSVEVLANSSGIHVLGICSKSPMVPPYFEEVSYCMPAAVDKKVKNELEVAAKEISMAIGLTSGPAHLEFRVNSSGVYILDIGLRIGGGGLSHDLVEISSGANYAKAALSELVGRESQEPLRVTKENIALLYLLQVGAGGKIKKLHTAEQGSGIKELTSYVSFVKVGDTLVGYPDYSGLPGYALFSINGRDASQYSACLDILNGSSEAFGIEYEA